MTGPDGGFVENSSRVNRAKKPTGRGPELRRLILSGPAFFTHEPIFS